MVNRERALRCAPDIDRPRDAPVQFVDVVISEFTIVPGVPTTMDSAFWNLCNGSSPHA
jgi:hypothetical protein